MGHYIDSNGISCFTPDDTDECFYIPVGFMDPPMSLSQILGKAKEKWPDGWKDLDIAAEHIHTECLYYDRYDPSDYTNYLRITRIKETE